MDIDSLRKEIKDKEEKEDTKNIDEKDIIEKLNLIEERYFNKYNKNLDSILTNIKKIYENLKIMGEDNTKESFAIEIKKIEIEKEEINSLVIKFERIFAEIEKKYEEKKDIVAIENDKFSKILEFYQSYLDSKIEKRLSSKEKETKKLICFLVGGNVSIMLIMLMMVILKFF